MGAHEVRAQGVPFVQLSEREVELSDRTERPWPVAVPKPGTHAQWQGLLLEWYRGQGRFGAQIHDLQTSGDSVWVDVLTGPLVLLSDVQVHGVDPVVLDFGDSVSQWLGQPASEEVFAALMTTLLARMTNRGHLAARVSISAIAESTAGVRVQLDLHPGPPIRLGDMRLSGDERTRSAALFRAAELRPGQALAGVERGIVRERLAATGWFDSVGEPSFELTGDSTATMIIPVQPASPGQFDLSAGSLPESGGGRNRWVGSGRLQMNNAFGAGRTVEVRVNRLPGQASSALLAFETPAPRNWPFVMEGRFEGYQQDSTFNRTSASGGAQLLLDAFTRLGGRFSWERSRAGQAGGQFVGDALRIPESSARYGGMTFRYRRLEPGRQPRNGILVATRLERGSRTIRTRQVVDGDTLSLRRSEPRERLTLEMAWFGLNHRAFGMAVGAEGQMVRVRRVDESELIPLGGATSLRGYDEDRFRGTAVGRAWMEARWYLDDVSRAFAFFDAGWVDVSADNRDSLADALRSASGFHPGYGIGFVFSTAAGPVSLSWALNPEEQLRDGRVHLSLSFGL